MTVSVPLIVKDEWHGKYQQKSWRSGLCGGLPTGRNTSLGLSGAGSIKLWLMAGGKEMGSSEQKWKVLKGGGTSLVGWDLRAPSLLSTVVLGTSGVVEQSGPVEPG